MSDHLIRAAQMHHGLTFVCAHQVTKTNNKKYQKKEGPIDYRLRWVSWF